MKIDENRDLVNDSTIRHVDLFAEVHVLQRTIMQGLKPQIFIQRQKKGIVSRFPIYFLTYMHFPILRCCSHSFPEHCL